MRASGDTATANFLSDFYRMRGFEVYEGAYSRYEFTVAAVPNILSMGQPPRFHTGGPRAPYWKSMSEVPYFAQLRTLRYDLSVTQSTYLDYCDAREPVIACSVEYGDAVRNIAFLEGAPATRARYIARYLLNSRSHLYRMLGIDDADWGRSVVGGGLHGMRELSAAIRSAPTRGRAIFAHLLIPHGPVDVDAACRILDTMPARSYVDDPARPTKAAWLVSLRLQSGQIRCAHRELARLLATIDSTVGRDGAIVVVHGDHGMRLRPPGADGRPIPLYSPQHLALAFSTLLAVRRPRVPAAVHQEAVPVQDFIWALARTGFAGPMPTTWRHYVRRERNRTTRGDTMRVLTANDMRWAKP
jgi:hypothetical protein